MARAAQSDLAVLAVLSVRPMSGYAVREVIREQLGHFWSESFGQIYPALSALEAAGHVERRDKTFALTDSGRVHLDDLLAAPVEATRPRNGLMLRLFFGQALGAERARGLVEEARTAAEGQLAVFAGLRALAEDEIARGLDVEQWPWWLVTISAGEHGARATIAWADETLAALPG